MLVSGGCQTYDVSAVLGRGSFGTIYLGEELPSRRRVAMKAVHCRRKNAVREAEAEAELLMAWHHPHVVRCHEYFYEGPEGDADRKLWLVLDLMDGGDLNRLYEQRRRALQGPWEASFVRFVISSIGNALDFVHGKGVLHRDVKCANVLLSGNFERICLADFGLACPINAVEDAPQAALGTPSYLPPEIICGRPHSPAADAWCLGVVAFKLAALRKPFEARDDLTLTMKIDTPADVACAVLGLLHKDQSKRLRPADAYEMTHASSLARLSRLAQMVKARTHGLHRHPSEGWRFARL
ncbi:unnamed protein product [Durusdinium trenchii]|uniref:Protein kinase domain-containing protein n=1 Tax=Durusdinium trenchii TaxID=1381693 RepID=A0ABP0LYG8_9DINO